jgi:hypothetical protein
MNAGSNRPSPRLASAHDWSTIAWPTAARHSGRPRSEGASATPIGPKRAFSSTPASTAATTPPPPPRTATAANCAEPANTVADITTGATLPMTGSAATPNETASNPAATAYGRPARTPSRSEAARAVRALVADRMLTL